MKFLEDISGIKSLQLTPLARGKVIENIDYRKHFNGQFFYADENHKIDWFSDLK